MGTSLQLPEPLVRTIVAAAAADHLTPEQFMQRLVDKHLESKSWQDLIERGYRRSLALGYTEDDVERLVHQHRAEKRQQS